MRRKGIRTSVESKGKQGNADLTLENDEERDFDGKKGDRQFNLKNE